MTAGATLPPPGLPGLDPRFSRIVTAPGRGVDAGVTRNWHCLDTGDELARLGVPVVGTILAVHGNPTWSYLWRAFVAESVRAAEAGDPAWRVVAVDQLDMGFSERTGARSARSRSASPTSEPSPKRSPSTHPSSRSVTTGAEWSRSAGRSTIRHRSRASCCSTRPSTIRATCPIPAPLRLAGARGDARRLDGRHERVPRHDARAGDAAAGCRHPSGLSSSVSVGRATTGDRRLRGRHPRRRASREPRRARADRRRCRRARCARAAAVGSARPDLQRPLPRRPRRPPSARRRAPLRGREPPRRRRPPVRGRADRVAERQRGSADRSRHDLAASGGRHRVAAVGRLCVRADLARLGQRRGDDAVAIVDMSSGGARGARRVSWRLLDDRVRRIAAGLHRIGVRKGDRVSLLVPPGPTLSAVVYACLRIGAVVVVADAGLGIRGLTRAVRGAGRTSSSARRRGSPPRARSAGRVCASRPRGFRSPRPPRSASPTASATSSRSGAMRALPTPPGPDDDGRDPLHLRLDRTREGRRLHARPALRAARRARRPLRRDARHRARHGLRAVRAAGSGARHPLGDARHGRLLPAHPHRGRGRRGRARVRRADRLPLPGRDPQRRRHRRPADPRRPRRARPACRPSSPPVHRSARGCSSRPRSSCRTRPRTRRTA